MFPALIRWVKCIKKTHNKCT